MHGAHLNVALPFVHASFIICLFHVSFFKTKAEEIHGKGKGAGATKSRDRFFILL